MTGLGQYAPYIWLAWSATAIIFILITSTSLIEAARLKRQLAKREKRKHGRS